MGKEMIGELELNRIYQRDCIDGMRLLPDKSIDMILCDLPYGTTRNKWDTVIPLDSLWEQYERIIKDNGAIVLTAQTPFDKVLGASKIKLLKYEWIWQKDAGTGFLNAKKMPLKDHENILVFYKKPPTYNPQMRLGYKPYEIKKSHHGTNYGADKGAVTRSEGERYPLTTIKFKRDPDKVHPTQKPVDLFEYLIKTYTNEGEIILDNCMGSGTTAVAAVQLNRNFIGFETETDYVQIANHRLEDTVRGSSLKEDTNDE
ncbi:Adenine-specific methyltransferase [Bacillus paralicheniformis]|uniref:Methyltransferase n=2 Tax=Bacillus paralicheniformis TaxID=1648923 RepID=A0A7Z0WTR6_9BACI|nr:Adenine-specific methyltransferase [Bacillus paralicheniformis]